MKASSLNFVYICPMSTSYKTEIDGLRGWACLLIYLYHTKLFFADSGFIGVDIFFVLSGFLITTQIIYLSEKQAFSISEFYFRRFRRIFPALLVVSFVCSAMAWVYFPPNEMKKFAESLFSSVTFLSNIYFYLTTGYFDISNQLKPLIHTWSLGIEEQFYILLPLVFLLSFGTKRHFLIITFLFFLSACTMLKYGATADGMAHFYLLPYRSFELLFGCLVAFTLHFVNEPKFPPILKKFQSLLGILLIVSVLAFASQKGLWPSPLSLVILVGTGLIISSRQSHPISRLVLNNSAIVGLGKISFSFYLWHQPVLAFLRFEKNSELTHLDISLASLLILALSYLTFTYCELPARQVTFDRKSKLLLLCIPAATLLAAFGVIGHKTEGFKLRYSEYQLNFIAPKASREWECKEKQTLMYEGKVTVNLCRFGDTSSEKVIGLYGDSHAGMFYQALHQSFLSSGIQGMRISIAHDVCDNPISGIFRENELEQEKIKTCFLAHEQVLKYAASNIDKMIISARWSYRLFPIPEHIETLAFKNPEGGEDSPSFRRYFALNKDTSEQLLDSDFKVGSKEKEAIVQNFIAQIAETVDEVYLIEPVPELGFNPQKRSFDFFTSTDPETEIDLEMLSINYKSYFDRNQFILGLFSKLKIPNLSLISPQNTFCIQTQNGRCYAASRDTIFYFDDNHLSAAGAKKVLDDYLKFRDWY